MWSKMANSEMMVMSSSIITKLPQFMEAVRREKAANVKKAVESEVVKIKLEAERNDYNRKRKLLIHFDDYESALSGALTKKTKRAANEERIVGIMKSVIHTIDDILKSGSIVDDIKNLSELIENFLKGEHEIKNEFLKSITGVVNHMYSEFSRIAEIVVVNDEVLTKKRISLDSDDSDERNMNEIRFKIEVLKGVDAHDPYKEEMRKASLSKEEYENELKKLTSVLEDLEKELVEVRSKYDNVQKELHNEQTATENLNKNFLQRRNEIQDEINSILDQTIEKQKELIEQRKKLGQTEQLEQRKIALLKQLEDAELKYADISVDYDCVFGEHEGELKQEDILENQLAQYDTEYKEAQEALDVKLAVINELRDNLTEELNAIQKELIEKEQINANNEEEVKALEAELTSIQEELNKTTSEIQKKKGRKKALKNEIKDLENQISELVMSQ